MNTRESILVKSDLKSAGPSANAHHKHKRIKELQKDLDRAKLGLTVIANTFHEFRTLLHSIRGFTKLMLDGKVSDSETQQEFLAIVDEQNQRLTNLVNEVTDIAAIESRQMTFAIKPVSLKALIEKAVGKLKKLAQEKNITLEAILPWDLPNIYGDSEKLEHAVTTLLSNAIKFSPEESNILVSAEARMDIVLVQIIDQGAYFLAHTLPELPQRITKIDDVITQTNNGERLNLYIAKQIIEAHGGQIRAESKPGKGNTFSFTIPVSPDHAGQTGLQEDAIARDVPSHGTVAQEIEQVIPVTEYDIESQRKLKPKRRPMDMADKSLLLRFDEKEWRGLLSVSHYLGLAPSVLARVLLKQAMSRYSNQQKLDDLFLLTTSPVPIKTPLSRREREILNLMAQGMSNKEIARIFNIEERTVKNHITSILHKLEANNRTHAVILALRHNLIEPVEQ